MQTITKKTSAEFRTKGSKFIGFFHPAATSQEVNSVLEKIRSEHPTATHHCYAYRINPNKPKEFSQDDGEPGGTAGLPILNKMRSADIMNAIVVIVRYYGGTKLGKPGLIEAYSHTTHLCIENSSLKKLTPVFLYKIEYDYRYQGIIDQIKNEVNWIEKKSTYMEHVTLICGFPISKKSLAENKLRAAEHLFVNLEKLGQSYHVGK